MPARPGDAHSHPPTNTLTPTLTPIHAQPRIHIITRPCPLIHPPPPAPPNHPPTHPHTAEKGEPYSPRRTSTPPRQMRSKGCPRAEKSGARQEHSEHQHPAPRIANQHQHSALYITKEHQHPAGITSRVSLQGIDSCSLLLFTAAIPCCCNAAAAAAATAAAAAKRTVESTK